MAPPQFDEILSNPDFQALDPEAQHEVRRNYFRNVITQAPEWGTLPLEQRQQIGNTVLHGPQEIPSWGKLLGQAGVRGLTLGIRGGQFEPRPDAPLLGPLAAVGMELAPLSIAELMSGGGASVPAGARLVGQAATLPFTASRALAAPVARAAAGILPKVARPIGEAALREGLTVAGVPVLSQAFPEPFIPKSLAGPKPTQLERLKHGAEMIPAGMAFGAAPAAIRQAGGAIYDWMRNARRMPEPGPLPEGFTDQVSADAEPSRRGQFAAEPRFTDEMGKQPGEAPGSVIFQGGPVQGRLPAPEVPPTALQAPQMIDLTPDMEMRNQIPMLGPTPPKVINVPPAKPLALPSSPLEPTSIPGVQAKAAPGTARQSAQVFQADMEQRRAAAQTQRAGDERLRQSPRGREMLLKQLRSFQEPPAGAIPIRPGAARDVPTEELTAILTELDRNPRPLSPEERAGLEGLAQHPQLGTLASKILEKPEPPLAATPLAATPLPQPKAPAPQAPVMGAFQGPLQPPGLPESLKPGARTPRRGAKSYENMTLPGYLKARFGGIKPGPELGPTNELLQEAPRGLAPTTFKGRQGRRIPPGVISQNGQSADIVLSGMIDDGWLPPDSTVNDLRDLIVSSFRGEKPVSMASEKFESGPTPDEMAIGDISNMTDRGELSSMLVDTRTPPAVREAAAARLQQIDPNRIRIAEAPQYDPTRVNPAVIDLARGLAQDKTGRQNPGPAAVDAEMATAIQLHQGILAREAKDRAPSLSPEEKQAAIQNPEKLRDAAPLMGSADLNDIASNAPSVQAQAIADQEISSRGQAMADAGAKESEHYFAKTEAGMQGTFGVTPERKIPTTGLQPKVAQKTGGLALEEAALGPAPESGSLFGEEKIKEPSTGYGKTQPPEPPAELFAESGARFAKSGLDVSYASDRELLSLVSRRNMRGAVLAEAQRREKMRGGRTASLEAVYDALGAHDTPPPLDDLKKVETDGSLLGMLGEKLKDEGGYFIVGQSSRSRSVIDDLFKFGENLRSAGVNVPKEWANVTGKPFLNWAWRKTAYPYWVAEKYPSFKRVYDPVSQYPRQAELDAVGLLKPTEPYLQMEYHKRVGLVDKALLDETLLRQDMPRFTPQELMDRGFDQEAITAFNSVLDLGDRTLKTWVEGNAKRIAGARIRAIESTGQPANPDQIYQQTLQDVASAYQGLNKYVPLARYGDKVLAVYEPTGALKDLEFFDSVSELAARKQVLQQEYPGHLIEASKLDKIVKSDMFSDVDVGLVDLLARLAKVDPLVREQFVAQVSPFFAQRGARAGFIQRSALPGFVTDLRRPIMDKTQAMTMYLRRMEGFDAADQALGSMVGEMQQARGLMHQQSPDPQLGAQIEAAKKAYDPELLKFSQKFLDDVKRPEHIAALDYFRNYVYLYFLGGNLKQFPVQMSQLFSTTYPALGIHTKNPIPYLQEGIRGAFAGIEKLDPEMQTFMQEMYKRGVYRPRAEMFFGDVGEKSVGFEQTLHEIAREEQPVRTRLGSELKRVLMMPTTIADMKSREASSIAFYRVARQELGMTPEQAADFAERWTVKTNFTFNRADMPEVMRGSVGKMLGTFRSWTFNYMNFLGSLYAKNGLSPQESALAVRAANKSLAATVALGGLVGSPAWVLWKAWSAWNGTDPEAEARRLLSDLPQTAQEVALRGVGAAAGVDLSRSLGIGDILPEPTIAGLVGAPGVVVKRMADVGAQVVKGLKAQTGYGPPVGPGLAETFVEPFGGLNMIKNAYDAMQMANQGVTSKHGGKLPGGEIPGSDIALKLAGFTPASVARAQSLQRATQGEITQHKGDVSQVLEQLATSIVEGDNEGRAKILEDLRAYNETVPLDRRVFVNRQQLKQRVAEMMNERAGLKRAPKTYRPRALELQGAYGFTPPPMVGEGP